MIRVPYRRADCQHNPKVCDHGLPVVQQNVLRFDVAMDHVLSVCVVQRARNRLGDLDAFFYGELFFPIQFVAQ